ncbi:MAG TPA: beta-N-acetylglucosaminidase domain-containing protein [Candidatus Fermentibacter daniensis]|nr:MAG: hypothetical protein AO396_06130 [Candidatus Fermentibacter daniensis]MBP7720415.1 beta-N-acetylglucosaminidase domain-containing protein [Candidatus Fermentibacter sp.]OQC68042.1 MAG: O-GlcNAcase NagJ precursor [candidate division Hyd24-12 bacterium ADurb.Bin004]KZD18803.1 MAG: hypothetical protein AO394_02585 [Candidatus Fermentibacter daniensis]KZD18839.1 MAG: hypothetical protein AO395_08995 [Candidatus Fermentibacter daniensis]
MGGFRELRGIVEGFYGRPYTVGHRRRMLEIVAGLPGSPTWLYAPKDDPFHRRRWREERPEADRNALRTSAGDARELGVEWIQGISPWKFVDDDAPILRRRVEEALEDGARIVAILFDDVEGPYTQELARRQNSLLRSAMSGMDAPVIVCPSVYCEELAARDDGTDYLTAFDRQLSEEWAILWTGPAVIPRRMELCASVAWRYGEGRLVLWDNLLADDYTLRRVYLGEPRDRIVPGTGYLLNPSSMEIPSLFSAWRLCTALSPDSAPPLPDPVSGLQDGLTLLAEFHDVPWGVRPAVRRLLDELGEAMEQGASFPAVAERALGDLASFRDRLVEAPGGFELLPYLNDITRLLTIWRMALNASSPRDELERLMSERLPWDHPLALGTARRLSG